jgi:large subunit ribosomal protein L4
MTVKLAIQGGSENIEVSDQTFGASFNEPLIHQVVTAYRNAGRRGTKSQKTRSDARGGGAKPWAQKGSGRARAGTNRSPIWVGGGRAFAARPRDYSQKVNRKMYRAAMRSLLSELVRQDRLVVVDKLKLSEPRTRELVARLKELELDHVLIVVKKYNDKLSLAARNLPWADVLDVREADPVNLLRYRKVLITSKAIAALEEQLS